jgi:hypothetical protein
MRQKVIAVLALTVLMVLAIRVKGQDQDSSDKTWPSLGSAEKTGDEVQPRFIIEHHKLELAQNVSNPLGISRCNPSTAGCFVRLTDLISQFKSSLKESILRPGITMHHYPGVLFGRHHLSSGTYVFYLPKQKVFYLYGDCAMGHADLVQGPYAGDPRVVLKKLAEESDAVALLGMFAVPFKTHGRGWGSSGEPWPVFSFPTAGIDMSKLERAQNVLNPLSLDRCRASSAPCVMNLTDFSIKRRYQLAVERSNQWGIEKRVLRPNVEVHYYPGVVIHDAQQRRLKLNTYVFYLSGQNIFYLGGYELPPGDSNLVLGPFAGDPRLVLKQFAE